MKSQEGQLLAVLVVVLGLCALGIVIEHTDTFRSYKNYTKSDTLPNTLTTSGRTGNELRMAESGTAVKPRLEMFKDAIEPLEMPSSRIVADIVSLNQLDLISVVIDPRYLNDASIGIASNSLKRGRSWERPAYVSLFNGKELELATGVGIRVHGGKSRVMAEKSYRLHFREIYGESLPTARVLFRDDADTPLPSVVLHNDKRPNNDYVWHYVNPIAYELASAIGSITPLTRPVQFYLNGSLQGPYVLTEHISRAFLEARFGHDQFVVADMKMDEPGATQVKFGDADKFEELVEWVDQTSSPLGFDELQRRVNIENLTNWAIGVVYAGVTDSFQGVALLDERDSEARWLWVNWDMDHAFSDLYEQADNDWEIDVFFGRYGILNSKRGLRSRLLNRILPANPEYRVYFLRRIVEVLNHVLTGEFVERKVAAYRTVAQAHGVPDVNFMDSIVQFGYRRPYSLRDQLSRFFATGDAFRMIVENPNNLSVSVDTYPIGKSYLGWYFRETPAIISFPRHDAMRKVNLTVNGEVRHLESGSLNLTLTSDTRIEVTASEVSIP